MSIQSMGVKSFKLISGEEIIARKKESLQNDINVEKPMIVALVETPQGVGINLFPWIISNKDAVATLNQMAVVAEIEPDSRLVDRYLQETTGIALASGM